LCQLERSETRPYQSAKSGVCTTADSRQKLILDLQRVAGLVAELNNPAEMIPGSEKEKGRDDPECEESRSVTFENYQRTTRNEIRKINRSGDVSRKFGVAWVERGTRYRDASVTTCPGMRCAMENRFAGCGLETVESWPDFSRHNHDDLTCKAARAHEMENARRSREMPSGKTRIIVRENRSSVDVC